MVGIIILVVVLAIALGVISIYNDMVKSRQKVRNSWSQIEVQLQRRFDLLPNLVETVKGYAKHEEKILEKVTELRSAWAQTKNITEKIEVGNELEKALKSVMLVSENYPDLKANTNFLNLQSQIKETEDKIAYSRQFYNDCVTMYNTKLEVFPKNIIAGIFNFKPETLFNVESEETRKNVNIKFD